jgi:hypothetical protein
MNLTKIGVLILIGFTTRLIVSCCDCPPSTTYKYKFDSIKLSHIDNSGQTPVYVDSGTIPKEAYGLQIELSLSKLALHKFSDFAGFNSTCAFDCFCPPETQYFPQDTLSAIRIISLNDFDNTHPANSEVSEYFKVLTYNTYITIQEYLDYPETIYSGQPFIELIGLYLMQAPLVTGDHRFRVEIVLSDGTTLISTSTLIMLE